MVGIDGLQPLLDGLAARLDRRQWRDPLRRVRRCDGPDVTDLGWAASP